MGLYAHMLIVVAFLVVNFFGHSSESSQAFLTKSGRNLSLSLPELSKPKSAEAPSEANASGRVDQGQSQIQPNPNPSPLGEGFMPPPYPLHGSGSLACWQ